MVEPHESHFWQMASRSGLVTAAQLQECWEAIEPGRRTVEAIDARLARQVVQAGWLTTWQAQQVVRGRAKSLQIEKYVLMDVIGQGGMGKVFLARDKRLNRRVALKVLSSERLKDERAVVRFRREARLGARLQHEHLVRIYDEGEFDGRCFLVMEYIEGPSVGQLLARHGPMPMSTASMLARQVALGLGHALEKGMVHRDVNPNNILVTHEGVAKLADMGLAIELGDEGGVTVDGGLLGNYDYVSPEQVHHSRDVDSRSDIYSLGCTLYHMVTGRVPFPSSTLPEKIHSQLTADPPPPSTLVAGLPKGFEELLGRMMRKSPEGRPRHPSEVAKALEPFIEGRASWGGIDASSILYPGTGTGDRSPPPSKEDSVVMPTPDDQLESSGPAGDPSVTSSEFAPPDPMPPPGGPDGRTWSTISTEFAASPAPRPPGRRVALAIRRRDLGLRRSWIARFAPRARGKRVALLASLVAAASLATALLAARLGGGWSGADPVPGPGAGPRSGAAGGEARGFLEVAVVGEDGKEQVARDLADAMRPGGTGDLRIVLRGRGPVRLESEGLEVASGTVTIAADAGDGPLLVVRMSGGRPFLRVGARGTLRLEGLSVRAEYGGRDAKAPPLIEAKGTLEMSRCSLWTTDPTASGGAVSAEGPRLAATGCWIGGFRQCLDVAAFAGTEVALDQCMMIQDPDGDPWNCWAIRIRHEPTVTDANARHLRLKRCTIRGACLLRADDFYPAAPLGVTIEGTAVQGGVLLAWKSESEPVQGGLRWSGRDNLYDLSRASRAIRLSGPPTAPGGMNDPDSWARMMEESGSRDRSIAFLGPASTAHDPPRPGAFSLSDEGEGSVGADPDRVGPESVPGPTRTPPPASPTEGPGRAGGQRDEP